MTDHKPLANIPESIAVERDGTGRRGRWAVELSSFDFKVRIRSGITHGNADALSRRPPAIPAGNRLGQDEVAAEGADRPPASTRVPLEGTALNSMGGLPMPVLGGMPESVVVSVVPATVSSTLVAEAAPTSSTSTPSKVTGKREEQTAPLSILSAQAADPTLSTLREAIERNVKPRPSDFTDWSVLRKYWDRVRVQSGAIGIGSGRRLQAAVPRSIRTEVIRLAHDDPSSGHMGRSGPLPG